MNFIISFFNTVLYQPFLNILVALYVFFPGHDLGVAVILLTLIIKLVLSPISLKAAKSQKALSKIQPKLKEIQNKYKDDKMKQSQEMMELYKKEKISPLSGCFPLIIQLPILIALYQVFLRGLESEALKSSLYSFIPQPGTLELTFLGIINLGQSSLVLAVMAGVLQFFHSKLSMSVSSGDKKDSKGFGSMMQKQMIYFFPFITVLIVWKLGSLIGLYWIVSTLFSITEQYIIRKPWKEKKKKE